MLQGARKERQSKDAPWKAFGKPGSSARISIWEGARGLGATWTNDAKYHTPRLHCQLLDPRNGRQLLLRRKSAALSGTTSAVWPELLKIRICEGSSKPAKASRRSKILCGKALFNASHTSCLLAFLAMASANDSEYRPIPLKRLSHCAPCKSITMRITHCLCYVSCCALHYV